MAHRVQGSGKESGGLWFPETTSPEHRYAIERHVAAIPREQAQQVLDELAGRMEVSKVGDPVKYCAALVARQRNGQFRPKLGPEIARKRAVKQHSERRDKDKMAALGATTDGVTSRLPPELRAPFERARAGAQSKLNRQCSDDKTSRT